MGPGAARNYDELFMRGDPPSLAWQLKNCHLGLNVLSWPCLVDRLGIHRKTPNLKGHEGFFNWIGNFKDVQPAVNLIHRLKQ